MEGYNAREDYTLGLKVFNAAGSELGWLPKPMNMTVAYPLSDMPSLTFEYMKDSPGAEWFVNHPNGLEVAVMAWIPGINQDMWIEPPNSRFLVLEWDDDVVDDHNIVRFTCPGYAWLLSKHLIMKGKNDDSLNAAEKAAEDRYDSAEAALKANESNLNSTMSDVKSTMKYSGGAYALDYFPKTIKSGGKTVSVPKKSVLYHAGRQKLYWYSGTTWYVITKKEATDKIPELKTQWANLQSSRATEESAREDRDKAVRNAREATKSGKRTMVSTTAGWAVKRHWDESKARGGDRLKGIFRTFNGTYCTGPNGVADKYKWQTRFDIDLTIGMSLLDLLNQLVEMGQIEWQFRGRHLDLFRPGLYDQDMSKYVGLHLGYDLTEAPDKATRHDFADYLVVRGEGDLVFGMANTGSDQRLGWGTWEKAVSASGATKVADAKKMVTQEAKSSLKRIKVQSTRGLIVRPGGKRPMYDYLPGHRIRVYGSDGTMQRVRIMQITLTTEAEGRVNGNLVLGDRFYRTAIDFRKSLSRTVGGYEKTIGGGSTPMPPSPTPRVPASVRTAPPSLAISAKVAINESDGSSGVALMLAWSPPGADAFERTPVNEEPGDVTNPGEFEPDY